MSAGSKVNFFATTSSSWTGSLPFTTEFNIVAAVAMTTPIDKRVIRRITSAHHDLTGHLRMNRTEVLVGSRRVESMGKLLVRVQHRRFEFLLGADDVVRHVVAV